ncbi:MAG: GerMN domain-containing protein [Clostridia bacterium]|nr:GerMN domain-containing protein [Clostridia bacterium]
MKKFIHVTALAAIAALMMCFCGCNKADGSDGLNGEESYSASSSLEMTEAQAESLENFMSVKLYYPSADNSGLVSETVLTEYTSKDKKVSHLVSSAVIQLLAGPKNTDTAKSLFPEGAEVESVKVKDGCAKISFNRTFGENLPSSADEMKLLVYSIVNTATEIKDIDSVMIFCAGDSMGTLENGFDMSVKFARDLSIVTGAASESSADAVTDPYAEELYLDVPLE